MKHKKVAIIGAGPAGIACAIQLKRYGIDTFLFEKNHVGGLVRNANMVENYLGFTKGISGKNLAQIFRKNLENVEIFPIFATVKKIDFINKNFIIETCSGSFSSEIIVVANGTKPKEIDFLYDKKKLKIFYEIVDLPKQNYTEKEFAIIGAGDAAFDYALNLVNNYNVSLVNILNKNSTVKCLPLLEERILATKKIKHIKNVKVNKIEKPNKKYILSCTFENNSIEIKTDYIISAIGRKSCLDFFDQEFVNKLNEFKSKKLIFFIGDVTNENRRQVSIAVGNGIESAMKIYMNN